MMLAYIFFRVTLMFIAPFMNFDSLDFCYQVLIELIDVVISGKYLSYLYSHFSDSFLLDFRQGQVAKESESNALICSFLIFQQIKVVPSDAIAV